VLDARDRPEEYIPPPPYVTGFTRSTRYLGLYEMRRTRVPGASRALLALPCQQVSPPAPALSPRMVTCGKCVRQFLDPLDALLQMFRQGCEVDIAPIDRLIVDLHQEVPELLWDLHTLQPRRHHQFLRPIFSVTTRLAD
jgi:hypothetical protein